MRDASGVRDMLLWNEEDYKAKANNEGTSHVCICNIIEHFKISIWLSHQEFALISFFMKSSAQKSFYWRKQTQKSIRFTGNFEQYVSIKIKDKQGKIKVNSCNKAYDHTCCQVLSFEKSVTGTHFKK